jgi:type IV pilus assembly protein PilB
MGEYQPVGEMLLSKGKITSAQLEEALSAKRGTRRRIGEVLIEMGFVDEQDVAQCLAEQFGCDLVDPRTARSEPEALRLLSGDVALRHRILPLQYTSEHVECIMADPLDFPTADMISRLAGRRAVLHIAMPSVLVDTIRTAYGMVFNPPGAHSHRVARLKVQDDRAAILAQLDVAMGRVSARGHEAPGSRKGADRI